MRNSDLPIIRGRLSKYHIPITVIEHTATFHNMTNWDKLKMQHSHEIPLKPRDLLFKKVLMCGQINPLFSLIRITKIKPLFIPSYNLTPKQWILIIRQQLFANVCRFFILFIAQIWGIPRRGMFIRLTSLCMCRLMVLCEGSSIADTVRVLVLSCCSTSKFSSSTTEVLPDRS